MNWKELEHAMESGWDEFIVQLEDRDGIPTGVIYNSNAETAIGNARLQKFLGYGLYGGEGGTFDVWGERRRIYCVHMRDPEMQYLRMPIREGTWLRSWDHLQRYKVDEGEERGMSKDEVTRRFESEVDLTRIINLDRDGYVERIRGFADSTLAILYCYNQFARGYKRYKEEPESPDEKCRTYCVYLKNPNESCPHPLFSAPIQEQRADKMKEETE